MWNLVADGTREGEIFLALFRKLEAERAALGGQVFDVLGKVFDERPLRELLIEAIRYGDQPEVRDRLRLAVEGALDRDHLRDLLEERALARDAMDASQVRRIREDMERAAARRLQPHFIAAFFIEAFRLLGGTIREREPRRFEITHVPAVIRSRDRLVGVGEPVLQRYERITFEKDLISVPGKALASFVCPGHPLLDATIDLVLERYRDLLKNGAILVDPDDDGDAPRVLLYLEHAIQDARTDRAGNRRVVSRQLQFVEIDSTGQGRSAGYAPYLDYRPITDDERRMLESELSSAWTRTDLEAMAMEYAVSELVPRHLSEVRARKEELVDRTVAAVKDRLTKEIAYWDHRAADLRAQEEAGRTPRLNSARARQRADELEVRLQRRMEELQQERQLSPLPPVVVGGALVVPAGLVARLSAGAGPDDLGHQAQETARIERLALEVVLETERRLGFQPVDVSSEKRGYDVESHVPGTGRLRFIEVKGRVAGARTVTVTKNEILTGLNKPDDYILAIVEVDGDDGRPWYVRQPFGREPDFGVTSVNYDLGEMLARAEDPSALDVPFPARDPVSSDSGGQVAAR